MLKKFLSLLSILGIALILLFILTNPSLLGSSTMSGLIDSDYDIAKFQMFSYFLLGVGIVWAFSYFIFRRYSLQTNYKQLLLLISVSGIVITLLALIRSPEYLVNNYIETKFLAKNDYEQLFTYQFVIIIFGCFLTFIPLILYSVIYYKRKILSASAVALIGLFIYSVLFYFTFLKVKYPYNIIFNPESYLKVKQLLLGQNILVTEFDPVSTLKVKRRKVVKAKYPAVDINFHMKSNYKTTKDKKYLEPDNLVRAMDSVNLRVIVNSDGFRANIDEHMRKYPDRFVMFDPTGFPPGIMSDEDFAELPRKLEEKVKRGAKGDGEIWKHLGLRTRDKTGKVVSVDDPRIDPFWAKAGELGVPIMWHMVDVPANFMPIDKHNERFEMLSTYPEFSHYDPGRIPPREKPVKDRENVLRKHPETIFIGCHMGMNPNDLEYVGYLLDTFPNYYVEMSTVLSELGRQPFTAREFFIKYQDRILFGTDGGSLFGVEGWTVEKFYQAHWEFLETDNEYISYPMQGAINQGSWKIYGINLPDSVLKKVYYQNAEKILQMKLVE